MRSQRGFVASVSTGALQCPFLYQTRTILGQHRHLHRGLTKASIEQIPKQSRLLDHRRIDDNDSIETKPSSFLKQKAAQVAPSRSKSGPTITAAEKAAFDGIWALFEKSSPSTPQARATSTDHTDTDYKNILELFSTSPPESHSVAKHESLENVIDQKPLFRSGEPKNVDRISSKPTSFDIAQQPASSLKLNREGAMAEIKGFLKETTSSAAMSSNSDSTSTQGIQSTALKIVEDVADSLTSALSSQDSRPDVAMWNVAEEKIFPLIKLLRTSTPSLSSPLPSEPASTSKLRSTTQPDIQNPLPSHPLIKSDTPLLPVLSLAYPSLTLLILRLYTTHIPTSPYILALLPTLKSLGPTSYVLGAHTHFYNTLLSLYWKIYSDLRGMNTLLTEMETNGVDFDIGTWEAIRAIEQDRSLDFEGGGERGQLWWERMEQRVWWHRVGIEWRKIVKRRLEEKGLSTGEVMRESYVGLGENSSYQNDDHVVTL